MLHVPSMEGLGVADSTSKCNTFVQIGGEVVILTASSSSKKG
jgi:hypothetical protein